VSELDIWAIVAGGSIGATARYLIGLAQARWTSWPGWTGIVMANLLGCLLIGVAVGMAASEPDAGVWITAFIMTGLCGALTTFSSFALDLALLAYARAWGQLTACILLSVAGGMVLVIAGRSLAESVLGGAA
jgi:CrcB protein